MSKCDYEYRGLDTFENYEEFKMYLDMNNIRMDDYSNHHDIFRFNYHNDGRFKQYIGFLIHIKNKVFPVTRDGSIIHLKDCDTTEFSFHDISIDTIDSVPKSATEFNIACCSFKKLPVGLKMVTQKFSCFMNELTLLEGAPKRVGGDFICSCNKLTSLKGTPTIINGDFDCSSNELTSLEGAPRIIGGKFSCGKNYKLKTLRGAPSYILGGFDPYKVKNETGVSQKQLRDYLSFLRKRPTNLMDENGNYLPKEF